MFFLERWGLRGELPALQTVFQGVALLLAATGAAGSVSLALLVGHRNQSYALLALFAVWVLLPFIALVLANLFSNDWSILTRVVLRGVTLVLTLGSLAIYWNMVSAPSDSSLAFPFLVVPLGSWLLIAIVTPMAAVISRRVSRYRLVRWVIKAIAAVVMLCFLGTTVLLGMLMFDHNRDTTLPTPTGSFAVGRTRLIWSDDSHPDTMAPQSGAKRELLAWIWYPAAPLQPSQTVDEYLPASWRIAMESRGLLALLGRDLSRVQSHSFRDAEVSPQEHSYPVVLMRTGGAAPTTDFTSLNEDLASHGYVVVGFDAPYRSWVVVRSDGSVVERSPQNDMDLVSGRQADELANKLAKAWSSDTSFALAQLEKLNASDPSGRFQGKLDMQRIGMFGHSLGGATALLFCHDDRRCKAGIDIDGVPLGAAITEGITQPFLFVISDHSGETSDSETPDAIRNAGTNIRSIYDRLPRDQRLEIVIKGSNHYMFSDGALLKSPLVMSVLRALGIVKLDGRRQIAATAHYINAFFDVYLKGAPPAELKSPSDFPEIEIVP